MLTAIRGGEEAVDNAHALLEANRRGNTAVPELSAAQISEQLGLAVDRVMNEGALCDRQGASLSLQQAQGDTTEAAFLLRAFRATLTRAGISRPLESNGMQIERRISPILKHPPGGQYLGATYDYTHRLLHVGDERPQQSAAMCGEVAGAEPIYSDRVTDGLADQNIAEATHFVDEDQKVPDLTRDPLLFPMERSARLQALARADEGFLVGLSNSTLQGYGENYPMLAELRTGDVPVEFEPPLLGFAITIGSVLMTECHLLNKKLDPDSQEPRFARGYGLALGRNERRAMAMAVVDHGLRCRELGKVPQAPIEDEEFVMTNSDGVDAAGLLQSLKLPHYVTFQTELDRLRDVQSKTRLREEGRHDPV